MNLNDVLTKFQNVKHLQSGEYTAHCPAHDDQKNSLAIRQVDDRILLCCHAGCPYERITSAAGLTPADLRNGHDPSINSGHNNGNEPKRQIENIYDYRDAAGNLLYQSVRYEPKDFRQRHPDGAGGWVWNMNEVERVLYRLPGLLAADPATPVFVVEGEKDANRLTNMGMVATTNVAGAGKWRAEYNQWLTGRRVIILPDNDEPGLDHAHKVAESLKGIADVTIVELPGLPLKGDVSDWLNMGHTKDDLLALVDTPAAPPIVEVIEDSPIEPETAFRRLSLVDVIRRPAKEWLIDNFLGKGDLGMLFGDPGTGKTFVTIEMIYAAIQGRPFAQKFHIGKLLTVAYAVSEGVGGLPGRFAAATNHYQIDPNSVNNLSLFLDIPQLYDDKSPMSIYTFINDWKDSNWGDLDLLILDTLHGSITGGDENSAKDMGLVLQAAAYAQRRLGATVLLIHHANKTGGYRGSSALFGALDMQVQTKIVTDGIFSLECTKLKDEARFTPLYFKLTPEHYSQSAYVEWLDKTTLSLNDDSKSDKKSKAKLDIMALLETEPNLTQKEIIERVTSAGKNVILLALKELEAINAITVTTGDKNKQIYRLV